MAGRGAYFRSFWSVRLVVCLWLICCLRSTGKRIVCIGDSITRSGACQKESYVDALAQLLGTQHRVVNAAVRGRALMKEAYLNNMNGNGSYWATEEWQAALHSHADFVTIMLGTNDAKNFNWHHVQQEQGDFYALDYVDMVYRLRAEHAATRIVAVIPPPVFADQVFRINATVVNAILPSVIRRIADVLHIQVLDIHSVVQREVEMLGIAEAKQRFSCDGVHPTPAMNRLIAQHMASFLAPYLSA